jgi:hypothetical protein
MFVIVLVLLSHFSAVARMLLRKNILLKRDFNVKMIANEMSLW